MKMREPPTIDWERLPEVERDAGYLVQIGLMNLGTYIDDFAAAGTLFTHCQRGMDYIRQLPEPKEPDAIELLKNYARWIYLAGRDGALTIYHFGIACDGIRQSLAGCPTLRAKVDTTALRAAVRDCRKHFPNSEVIRHSIAHAADKVRSPQTFQEHSFSGSFKLGDLDIDDKKGITVTHAFVGQSFFNSWKGKIHSYELSPATLHKLMAIKNAIWDRFEPEALQEILSSATPDAPQT